jgi:hypothetical protein
MTTLIDPSEADIAVKLLIEEYKSCRDLIAKNIDIIEKTEFYAVGSSAAVAVFSISQTERLICLTASYLPLAIAILGLLRFLGIDSTIRKINNYLIDVEKRYKSQIGWTHSYRAQNTFKSLKYSRYAIWIILLGLSVIFIHIAYLKPFYQH